MCFFIFLMSLHVHYMLFAVTKAFYEDGSTPKSTAIIIVTTDFFSLKRRFSYFLKFYYDVFF